jgi:hypothetical protein
VIIIGSKERLNALKISSCKKIGEIDAGAEKND